MKEAPLAAEDGVHPTSRVDRQASTVLGLDGGRDSLG